MLNPNDPLDNREKLMFGHDAKRHPVTGHPLELGSGALPEHMQARLHLRVIADTDGPEAAEAMRRRLAAAEQPLELVVNN